MEISQPIPGRRYRDLALVAFAYILAFFAAAVAANVLRDMEAVWTILWADIAGTLVIYLFGRVFRNASFYDPYWSVAPIVIALFWVFGVSGDASGARQAIVITLVFAWGLRLTYNWARGWQGVKDEDWRYRNFRNTTGKWFWFIDLFGIELMPTTVVFLGCLSLYPALAAGDNTFNILDVIAIIITVGAVLLEAISDEQLKHFAESNPRPGEIMNRGLWAYSRHPNYLGEVSFWWGLYFFGLAADTAYWWTIIGPAAITLLFTAISIPMIEKRHLARKPGYAEHQKKVSPLLLWFPRKTG